MKRKKYTLEDLIKGYQSIRKKHGDKAKSSKWVMSNKKYKYLYCQVRRMGLAWKDFKSRCGFDDHKTETEVKEELIKGYQSIRAEHGDNAKSSDWMVKNGYGGFYQRLIKHYSSWNKFKKNSGFDEEPLKRDMFTREELIKKYIEIRKEHGDKAKSSGWMVKNGYEWLYYHVRKNNLSWGKFRKISGFDETLHRGDLTLKELTAIYIEIREKHGNKAQSSKWIKSNGYEWLYARLKKLELSWNEFKEESGFYETPLHMPRLPIGDLISHFLKIENEKSSSAKWIQKSKYNWIYGQVNRVHKISWPNFIKLCEGHFNVDKEDLMI